MEWRGGIEDGGWQRKKHYTTAFRLFDSTRIFRILEQKQNDLQETVKLKSIEK